ncbi:MAG: DUF4347 domain-containing protein, partial [Hyphomicrobiales bacterium]|nr:DUF4347 domain-containing protein [Hyphomicrobiales bacterium]
MAASTKRKKGLAGDPYVDLPSSPTMMFRELESRIVFDAAMVATADDALADGDTHDIGANLPDTALDTVSDGRMSLFEALALVDVPAPDVSANAEHVEIVFIDGSVDDAQTLIAGIDPNSEIVLLDSSRDGVEQIAEVLAGRTGIDAIHLISHGSEGTLVLGSGVLTLESMSGEHADELAAIGAALSEQGDILVYGCDFGEGADGAAAVAALAEITGADVAASIDATGSTALGGDWDLEVHAGDIETELAVDASAQDDWAYTLATVNVSTTLDTVDGNTSSIANLQSSPGADGKISLREAIIAA